MSIQDGNLTIIVGDDPNSSDPEESTNNQEYAPTVSSYIGRIVSQNNGASGTINYKIQFMAEVENAIALKIRQADLYYFLEKVHEEFVGMVAGGEIEVT